MSTTRRLLKKAGKSRLPYAVLTCAIVVAALMCSIITNAQTGMAAGLDHSIFLKSDGTVWTCGLNDKGQLGDGTMVNHTIPAQVAGLSGIIAVSGGKKSSLFLKNDGTVWGCGYNEQGEIGNGTLTNVLTPVQVGGLATHSITAIAAGGFHSLFLEDDGSVWATGYNMYGALGRGDNVDLSTPLRVSGITNVKAIAAGDLFSVFLKTDGTVWVCGYNSNGQLGLGTFFDVNVPERITALSDITAISAGVNHILFLKADGTVMSCGLNTYGRLGSGSSSASSVPVNVVGLTNVTRIAAGEGHSLFVKGDGTAWACGDGNQGRLGEGSNSVRYSPIAVSTLNGLGIVTNVAAGAKHSLFMENNCQVWAAGSNEYGQIGDPLEPLQYWPVLEFALCAPSSCDVNVSNFAVSSATSPCLHSGSTVILTSNTLHNGSSYTANYTLSGAAGNNETRTSGAMVWSSNSGSFVIDPNVLVNIGPTTVTINYITEGSCQSASLTTGNTANFTVRSIPYFTAIGNNGPACTGNTLTLSSTVNGGTGGYTYSWSGPSGFSAAVASPTVTTSAAAGNAGTYTLSVTDAMGCMASPTTTAVAVTNIAPISGITSVTVGATTNLSNATVGGAWSSVNTNIATVSSLGVVTGVAPGNTAISYTLSGGCAATVTVTVSPGSCSIDVSNFSVTSATSPCLHGSSTVVINSSTMAPGTYTVNYTLSGASGNSGTAESAPFTFVAGAGSFIIDQSLLTNTGATTVAINYVAISSCHSATMTVDNTANFNVNSLPSISAIGNNGPVCVGDALSLNSTVIGGDGNYTYTWTGPLAYTASTASAAVTANATVSRAGGYSLTVTDGNSCSTAANTTVVVTAVAPITGTLAVGVGNIVFLNNATNSGVWSVDNTSIATISASGVATGVAPGSTEVRYTIPGGCIATATLTVVTPGALNNVCVGQQITLGDGGAPGGTWASGNGALATVSPLGVVSGVAAGTVLIYYFPPMGAFVTNTITVKALSATVMPASVCQGQSVTASNATPGGGIWSSSNTAVAIIASGGNISTGAAGTSVISFVSITGCIAQRTLTVIPSPEVSGSGSLCMGRTIQLSTTTPGGIWQTQSASVATVSSAGVVTGVGAGTVRITNIIANGCSNFMYVTVKSLQPIVSAGNLCQGQVITATNATPGGGLWSSDNTSVADVSTSGAVTGTGGGTATISFTAVNGCVAQKTLTVSSSPQISGPSSVCVGQSIQLSSDMPAGIWSSQSAALATVTSSGLVTGVSAATLRITQAAANGCSNFMYVTVRSLQPIVSAGTLCQGQVITATNATPGGGLWSSDNTSVADVSTSGAITGTGGGTATISFTAVNGCVAQKTLTVLPAPQVSGVSAVCVGQTIELSSNLNGGAWQSANAAIATVTAAGVVTGAGAGTVFISYALGTGCAGTATITVRALSSSVMPASMCQGDAYNTATNATPGGGIWSSSNTTVAVVAGNGAITTTAAGTTVISFVSTTGCITQNSLNVMPAPHMSGPSSVCVGQSIQLSTDMVGGTWFAGTPGRISVSATGLVTGRSAGPVLVWRNVGSCYGIFELTVNPLSPIVAVSENLCENFLEVATNATPGGGVWSSSNTAVATVGAATGGIRGVAPGTATIYFESVAGCVTQKDFTVHPGPIVSGSSSVCVGQTIQMSSTYTATGGWSVSFPARATVSPTGLVTGLSAGTIAVLYVTADGCVDGIGVTVRPLSPSTVPATICQGAAYYTATNATPGGGIWSSSNTGVADVASDGHIIPGAAGTTTISFVSTTGCITQNTLTVLPAPQLSGATSVCVGQSVQLSSDMPGGTWAVGNSRVTVSPAGLVSGVSAGPVAIVYNTSTCASGVGFMVNALSPIVMPDNICQGSITGATNATPGGGLWSSSNTLIATINTSGTIIPLAPGTTEISFITAAGCIAQKTLTVMATPAISGGTAVCVGQTLQLSSGITSGGVWSTLNPARATVSSTGLVTGVSSGQVLVGYSIGSCSAGVILNVGVASPINSAASVCAGQTITATNATPGGGIWSSGNTTVAIVSASGVISGLSSGSTAISFTTSGGCVVTKTVSVSGPQLITGFPVVCQGQRTNLSSSTPGGNWSSSSGAMANITSAGVVTGVAAGSPVIYYVLPTGCWTSVTMTVRPLSPTTGGTPSICQSGSMTLANATPGGGVWSSSNTAVATVGASGFVRGQGAGVAVISFTTGFGCVQSRTVTVNACREAQDSEGVSQVAEVVHNTADLNLFPNPNRGAFTLRGDLSFPGDEITTDVINMLGQVVYHGTARVESGTINHNFSLDNSVVNGSYLLRLTGNGFARMLKFTVNR